ncbi:hypothetical protein [Lacticaseibacillus paracasei]|uniref:hypothetical protein n=1 Tax=Lacticaseibacillus paracasei TaxID=1597 RepID=UPI0007BF4CF6|nr:hypothetical protein [Lacticaseibacillus paracasei]URW90613.1 hypothetical protein NCY29_10695 [Lacticaseibacillus paracasei]
MRKLDLRASSISTDFFVFLPMAVIFIGRFFMLPKLTATWFYGWILFEVIIVLYSVGRLLNNFLSVRGKVTVFGLENIVLVFLLIISVIVNLIIHGFNALAISNLVNWFSSVTMLLLIPALFESTSFSTRQKILKKVTMVLNLYFWINVPLIFLEGYGLISMANRFLGYNSFLPDQTTGLIGFNGTGTVAVFWLLLAACNFAYLKGRHSRLLQVNFFVEIILMVYMSMNLNEIKSFIPLMAVLLFFLFIMPSLSKFSFLNLVKGIFGVSLTVIIAMFAYSSFPALKQSIDKLMLLVSQILSLTSTDPSNERSYITSLIFNNYNGQGSGIGFANLNENTQTIHIHLGMNDFNIILISGGLIFFILLCLTAASFIGRFSHDLKFFNANVTVIFITGYLFLLAVATRPFSDPSIFFFTMLLYLPLQSLNSQILNERDKKRESLIA